MHDEHLSHTIKTAGESFAPPPADVGTIVRRGRRRRWTARPVAIAASIALVAASAAAVARIDFSDTETAHPSAVAPAALTSWDPIEESPIEGRYAPLSAWTGSELIVWGGNRGNPPGGRLDGAAYDPARDKWSTLPRSPLRISGGRTAVWTGEEMILWGGEFGDGSHVAPDQGAAYDPATRKWRRLPQAPYWSLAGHVALWTGTEMIVWGGVTTDRNPAAAYNPATNRWRSIPAGPLGSRHGAGAVWTGDRMIVFGGKSQDGVPVPPGQGASFDPASGTWTPIAESPVKHVDAYVTDWTGTEMIVAGGLSTVEMPKGGAVYDPAADSWREIADLPLSPQWEDQPIRLTDMSTVGHWTGEHVVYVTADGVLGYSPEDDEWTTFDAPEGAAVEGATTAWTGEALLVWSGRTWDDPAFRRGGWVARYVSPRRS